MRAQRGFTLIELLVVMTILGVLATFLRPVLKSKLQRRDQTVCANNLRQIALAAIHYSDRKRFYPHARRILETDGDVDTNHATKAFRALLWSGYLDDPQTLVCPASQDAALPVDERVVQGNPRRWFWGGAYAHASEDVSPLADQAPDPVLQDMTEASYGWTRRAYNTGVRSTALLGADRAVRAPGAPSGKPGAVGNHEGGWNVVTASAEVQFVSTDERGQDGKAGVDWLRSTEKYGGYLAIADQELGQ